MTIKAFNFIKINNLKNKNDREVKGMIITLALFAAGMIIGAGLLKYTSNNNNNEFITIFNEYAIMRTEQKAFRTFLNSLAVNLFFIFLINFAGLSCIGIPITVFITLIKGIGLGFFAGYLFSQFSMSGIGYYLITVLPGAVVSNTALLLACNSAVFLSADILAIVLIKKQSDENLIKNYLKKNMLLIIICITASMIDCILIKAFSFMFVF